MPFAYYNEIDEAAASVLRQLISDDVIAPGDVDTRSIKDVQPDDLRGYTQCHFFAGGGLWSVAARLAGFPDDRELWTGSCPCQPFSAAGKGAGIDDPRHLWPDFYRLIRTRRPVVVMGEQVAGAAGYGWFDGVSTDLANEDFASRTVDIPACAVDAPHQRNRLYWLAVDDSVGARLERQRGDGDGSSGRSSEVGSTAASDDFVFGNTARQRRREGWAEHELRSGRDTATIADVLLQSDTYRGGRAGRSKGAQRDESERAATERADGLVQPDAGRELRRSRPLKPIDREVSANAYGRNGSWWADAEWIVSPLDGKARRTKPGLPFLVDGLPGRVDLWRVGGNAIVPILAAEVIAAYLETEGRNASA